MYGSSVAEAQSEKYSKQMNSIMAVRTCECIYVVYSSIVDIIIQMMWDSDQEMNFLGFSISWRRRHSGFWKGLGSPALTSPCQVLCRHP